MLNVSFTGNIYDTNSSLFSGDEVKYQLYFYSVNGPSSPSIWSTTRISEYGQYNINLGDSDILTQDGNSNTGDIVLLAFWTPNTSIRTDVNLQEWGFFEVVLDGSSAYTNDVQIKGPMVPEASYLVEGATTINADVIATDENSNDVHSWMHNFVDMWQKPTQYGQSIFPINELSDTSLNIDWDDGTWTSNASPTDVHTHQYTAPDGTYSITFYITNKSGLTDTQIYGWTVYYNAPTVDFSIDKPTPDPIGTTGLGEVVTFTNTTDDPDGRALVDGWTCDWTIDTTTYLARPLTFNPTHQFDAPGTYNVTLTLHWYNGHAWTTSTRTRTVIQQVWSVSNGLTWITPVVINVENTFTPNITGDVLYISKVDYIIDSGAYGYLNLAYNQGFYYTFDVSQTHTIRQDIYYNNGFTNEVQTQTFNVAMNPVADFTVTDDVCGDLYTSTSVAGAPPFIMYVWRVYLNDIEVAALSGANRNTFTYNWSTIGTYKILLTVTDSANNQASMLKTYVVNSCKTGGGGPTSGGFAGGGGVIVREKPLPKIKVKLEKDINKHINVVVKLLEDM